MAVSIGRLRPDPLLHCKFVVLSHNTLRGAAGGFEVMTGLHNLVFPELFDEPHVFESNNSDGFGADISGTDNLYMFATYDLADDEALLIEADAACRKCHDANFTFSRRIMPSGWGWKPVIFFFKPQIQLSW